MADLLWFDSGWPPNMADLVGRYVGYLFYLDPGDHRRPDPSKAQLDAYLAAGLDLAMIWQHAKIDIAAGGYDLGVQHAEAANVDADLKGGEWWEPIIYACDANRTITQVEAYYRGVQSVPGRPVGAYAGGNLIDQLHTRLGIEWFMEAAARAWDTNLDYVSPRTQFWQRDPNVKVGNSYVDQVVPLKPYPTRKTGPPMSTPITPAQRKAAFLAEGLKIVEIPGWTANDRGPVTGRPALAKYGTVNHHTGGDTSDPYKYAASVLFKGYSGLPGPLCDDGLDIDTGTIYMVGTGCCNHAGGGDPAVLAAVRNDAAPLDRELKPTKGNSDGVNGNRPLHGLEAMYSGSRDVPRVGYVAWVKWNTALCRFYGWTGGSCIAHREWSDDKPDPGRVNLPQLRRDVNAALALPAGQWPAKQREEDDMFSDQDRKDLETVRVLLQWGFDTTLGTGPAFATAGELTNAIRQNTKDIAALGAALAAVQAARPQAAPEMQDMDPESWSRSSDNASPA